VKRHPQLRKEAALISLTSLPSLGGMHYVDSDGVVTGA
jgi:hypothetical protein